MSALLWTFRSPFSHASTCSNTLKVAPGLKWTEELWAHGLTSYYLHLLMSDFSGIWDWIRVVSELGLGPREIHGDGEDCSYEHLCFVPLNNKAFVLCSSCQIPVLCLRAERSTHLSQRHFQKVYTGHAWGSRLSEDTGRKRGPAQRGRTKISKRSSNMCWDWNCLNYCLVLPRKGYSGQHFHVCSHRDHNEKSTVWALLKM